MISGLSGADFVARSGLSVGIGGEIGSPAGAMIFAITISKDSTNRVKGELLSAAFVIAALAPNAITTHSATTSVRPRRGPR